MTNIQTAVDIFASRAASEKFQLNELGCKKMRICFSTNGPPDPNPIVINDKQIDVISHAKILSVNISSDLQWKHHISEVVRKARKCLFCLAQLKRVGLGPNGLVHSIGSAFVQSRCMLALFFMTAYLCIFLMS